MFNLALCFFEYSHLDHSTTFDDPRLLRVIQVAHDGTTMTLPTASDSCDESLQQRFDGSSTAADVLKGVDLTGVHVVITGATGGIGWCLTGVIFDSTKNICPIDC